MDWETQQLEEEELQYLTPRARVPERFSLEKTYNPIQLMLAEHERFFKWTTKDVDKDRRAYYSLAFKVLVQKGESSLKSRLNWAREKRVHIKALLKVLAK